MASKTSYYDFVRKDILNLVPEDVRAVLSVGCGAGRTEEVLVRKGVRVVGVEINRSAAALARERGVDIIEGDIIQVSLDIPESSFDCVIFPDILEHIIDPVKVMRRVLPKLRENGTVIVSVPNFRHYRVLYDLFVKGEIRYVAAVILDRTHVRITTRKMVLEWFSVLGIDAVRSRYMMRGRFDKILSVCMLGLAREFICTQVAVTGKKPKR